MTQPPFTKAVTNSVFYLLVVAALGDELRSREGPGEKSQRTQTLVSNCTRHVHRNESGAVSERRAALSLDHTSIPGGGANLITSAHVHFTETSERGGGRISFYTHVFMFIIQ